MLKKKNLIIREKLIALLDQNCGYVKEQKAEDLANCLLENANYLFENNIIRSPVKVGDTVYGISRNEIIPLIIKEIRYNKNGIELISTNEQNYGYGKISLDPNNKFGMEWYKTKEEAEKTLEEKQ